MHRLFNTLAVLTSVVLPLATVSCGTGGANHRQVQRKPEQRLLYRWYDDGGAGKVTVRISLTDQIAEFKRGERDIGWCYVATGKEGHSTSPGTYKITEKIEDKYSNLYGWHEDEFGNVTNNDARSRDKVPVGMTYVPAPMPFWMRLTSYGVGMHGGIIPQPGEPASHGCIRIPKEFVPILYDAVNVGTQVVITHSPSQRGPQGPSYQVPQVPQEVWSSGGGMGTGGVQSVRYRDGMPISYQ
ncbi:MAG: L,D-transpeptidase family protein [Luteolibacter sp.]